MAVGRHVWRPIKIYDLRLGPFFRRRSKIQVFLQGFESKD